MRHIGVSVRLTHAACVIMASDAPEARSHDGPARSVRLDVTRDTWVSEVGQEADGNNGGAPRLKLKSIQEMTLVDVDASAARGADDPIGRAAPEEGRR